MSQLRRVHLQILDQGIDGGFLRCYVGAMRLAEALNLLSWMAGKVLLCLDEGYFECGMFVIV